MEYHSKYTGAEVDALLDKVNSGEVGGKVTVDSALSTTSENPVQNKVVTVELNKKVDKEDGKGLSTNDYTDEEQKKVKSILNGDILSLKRNTSGIVDISDNLIPVDWFSSQGMHATFTESGAGGHDKTLFLCVESTDGADFLGKIYVGTYDHDNRVLNKLEIKEVPDIATQSEIDALFDSGTSGGGSTSY